MPSIKCCLNVANQYDESWAPQTDGRAHRRRARFPGYSGECRFSSASESESESVYSEDSGASASKLERDLRSGEICSAARANFERSFVVGLVGSITSGGIAGVVEETCTLQVGRLLSEDCSMFLQCMFLFGRGRGVGLQTLVHQVLPCRTG